MTRKTTFLGQASLLHEELFEIRKLWKCSIFKNSIRIVKGGVMGIPIKLPPFLFIDVALFTTTFLSSSVDYRLYKSIAQ